MRIEVEYALALLEQEATILDILEEKAVKAGDAWEELDI